VLGQPRASLNGLLTGGCVALCLTVDRVAKQELIFRGLLGFPRTLDISQAGILVKHKEMNREDVYHQ